MNPEDPIDPDESFTPSYTGTRNEQLWIQETLGEFYQDQLITDVLYKVKGGKEANVYCCAAHPDTGFDLIAAKVYRPQQFRAMKNDRLYRLGRQELTTEGKAVRDARALRAVHQASRFGQELRSASWIRFEYDALCDLYEAGVNVPLPIAIGQRAILMEFLGDHVRGAPTLHETALERAEAHELFRQVILDVEAMLDHHRIHADLSAYNILYIEGRVAIIDLPQCVDPHTHPLAFMLLSRDVERVCQYFVRQEVECDANSLTERLWQRVRGGA